MRLSQEEIEAHGNKSGITNILEQLNIQQRAVLTTDEDSNTFAIMAAKDAISNAGGNHSHIQSLYFATRTDPYTTRPSSTLLSEVLALPNTLFTQDVHLGNRSGMAALQMAKAMVKSGLCENSLVVASDVIGRYTPPGSFHELFAGAGSAGLVISKEQLVAEIEIVSSGFGAKSNDLKALDRQYRIDVKDLSVKELEHSESVQIEEMLTIINRFFKASDRRVNDFDHVIFHQPYGRIAERVGLEIGFNKEQMINGLIAPQVGDCGCAGYLLGLVNVLDNANAHESILMMSIGSGGWDIVCLQTTPELEEKRKRGTAGRFGTRLEQDIIHVPYARAMKHEQKYQRVPYALNAYM